MLVVVAERPGAASKAPGPQLAQTPHCQAPKFEPRSHTRHSRRSRRPERVRAQVEARAAAGQALGAQLLAAGELLHTLRPLLYVLALRWRGPRPRPAPYPICFLTRAPVRRAVHRRLSAAAVQAARISVQHVAQRPSLLCLVHSAAPAPCGTTRPSPACPSRALTGARAARWGRASWRPWALSLAADLLAARLLAAGAAVQRGAAAEAAAEPALAFGSVSLLYSLQAHRRAAHAMRGRPCRAPGRARRAQHCGKS
jgi:hypothetical protein